MPGRFDLFKFLLRCNNCNFEVDIFSDVPYIIASRYWPGTVDTVTFLFDEDMFISWDSFRLRMPGSSEYGFLNSLSDISKDNNRVNQQYSIIPINLCHSLIVCPIQYFSTLFQQNIVSLLYIIFVQ